MIKIISAVSGNGIIGKNNKLPFYYPEDLKHFKKLTINSTIIMGRNTFDSIGEPLPKRKNVVITSRPNLMDSHTDLILYPSLIQAVNQCKDENIWLIGGAHVYEEGMKFAEEIHLTITSDIIVGDKLVKFPWINPLMFKIKSNQPFPYDSRLSYIIYEKIK